MKVATDELYDADDALAGFAAGLERARGEVAEAVARIAGAAMLLPAHDAAHEAHEQLLRAAESVARLRRAVRRAVEDYELVESTARALFDALAGATAHTIGAAAVPLLPAWALLAAGPAAAAAGLLVADPWLMRDPRVIGGLRFLISQADQLLLGAAHVPLPLALAADDGASGVFGVRGAADVVVRLARILPGRVLEEDAVAVHPAQRRPRAAAPPLGFGELAGRIPPSTTGGPQLRIERYDVPGQTRPRWIVYSAGTIDPGFVPEGEPWDDTSNLTAVAGRASGAIRAARQAMEQAGVQSGDEVIPVGYSQGGLVATAIAQDPELRVPLIVTFGSPTAGARLQDGTLAVAVEHVDDLIPALGGLAGSPRASGSRRLVIRLPSGADPRDRSPIAGHAFSSYRTTASALDASRHPETDAALAALAAFTSGAAAGTAMSWRADRLPPQRREASADRAGASPDAR